MEQLSLKKRFLNIDLPIIIKGCQQHDLISQQQLYKFCYPEMIKTCFRYAPDADGAGIIFNNAMLRVFRSIGNYTDEGKLLGWVKTIVLNCCIDFCKQKNIFKNTMPPGLETEIMIQPSILDQISGKEIGRLIAELPAATATVFNLFAYEGFTHKQIAALLGISDNTSKWHVSEAKKTLKAKLETGYKSELKVNAAG